MYGFISAIAEKMIPHHDVTQIQRSSSFHVFRCLSGSPSAVKHYRCFERALTSLSFSASESIPAYSAFGTIFMTCSAASPACRNCLPSPKSPHCIPLEGKSSSCVVAAHSTLMLPNICGMKPSRLYVKAHQHTPVMSRLRNVAVHTGYAA